MKDYGNLSYEEVLPDEPVGRVKHPRAVGDANRRLSEAVRAVKRDGHTAVVLGGDHRFVSNVGGWRTTLLKRVQKKKKKCLSIIH